MHPELSAPAATAASSHAHLDEERVARVGLLMIEQRMPHVLQNLFNHHYDAAGNDPVVLWHRIQADADGLFAGLAPLAHPLDASNMLEHTENLGARVIVPGDDEWPTRLNAWGSAAPWCLWARGPMQASRLNDKSIAITGARAASPYGVQTAGELGYRIATAEVPVVSGIGYGIEAAATRGALAADSENTTVVLSTGIDVPFPAANEALVEQVANQGLVLSAELPGTLASRFRFVAKARLLGVLSNATVLVEAGLRSTSRATVAVATDLDRPIGGVPGPVTSATSAGVHELIKNGTAHLVTDASDCLGLLEKKS